MFLLRFYTKAWTLAIPLTILVIGCPTMYLLGLWTLDRASFVSTFGTVWVLFINALYIIFWHSKKRWKNASAMERAGNLFTFKQ